MGINKYNLTILLIISILVQNFAWAYGQQYPHLSKDSQDKLAKDTELDNAKFIAVSKGLGKILSDMEKIIRSRRPPTEEAIRMLKNDFLEVFLQGKSEEEKDHYRKHISLFYLPSTKSLYLYSIKPRNGPGVVYRVGLKEPINDPFFADRSPFHSESIGNLKISLFTGPLTNQLGGEKPLARFFPFRRSLRSLPPLLGRGMYPALRGGEQLSPPPLFCSVPRRKRRGIPNNKTAPNTDQTQGLAPNLLQQIITIFMIPILIFVFLTSPMNINPASAQSPEHTVELQPSRDLGELIRLYAERTKNYGLVLQYDSLTGGSASGNANLNNEFWGFTGTAGLGNPIYNFRNDEGVGGLGLVYVRPGDNLWLTLKGGLLPDYSPDSTYLFLVGIETGNSTFHPYLHLGFLGRRLDNTYGNTNALLVDSGLSIQRGGFGLILGASGPIHFRPSALIVEDYRRVVSDLSLLRARLMYEGTFWRVGGRFELGGLESRLDPALPSNRFSRFGIDGGLKFDFGQLDLALTLQGEHLNPSFSDKGANLFGPSIDIDWRDISLRTGIWLGPFVRPYGELLYRLMNGLALTGGYNSIPPIYHPALYEGPFSPKNLVLFGLRYGGGTSSSPIPPSNGYPVQSPTGTAIGELVYGPFVPLQAELDDKILKAKERLQKSLRKAVSEAETFDEAYTIYSELLQCAKGDDIGSTVILSFTSLFFWQAFYKNPRIDLFWMRSLRERIQTDSNVYKIWNENGYSYRDILNRLLGKRYVVRDSNTLQILTFELNQLIDALQSSDLEKRPGLSGLKEKPDTKGRASHILDNDTLNAINNLLYEYMARLESAAPGSPEAIFTYYVSSSFFTILTKYGRYPGVQLLTRLTEDYITFPPETEMGLAIPDQAILAELLANAGQWIMSDDLSVRTHGLLILEFLLITIQIGETGLPDSIIERLYEISLEKPASGLEKLPQLEPLVKQEGQVSTEETPLPIDKNSLYFQKLKASLMVLDILVRCHKPVDKTAIKDLFNEYKRLPIELKDELEVIVTRLAKTLGIEIGIKDIKQPGLPQRFSWISPATLLPLVFLLLPAGCSGAGIGSLGSIVILLTLVAVISYTTVKKVPYRCIGARTLTNFGFLTALLSFAVGIAQQSSCVIDKSGLPTSEPSGIDGGIIPDGGPTDGGQPNQPPIASAGIDQTIDENTLATLDGSSSSDPERGNLIYKWKQIDEPIVDLHDSDKAQAWFTAPSVEIDTILKFRLTVTDPTGLEDSDEVEIIIRNVQTSNNPPVFTPTGNFTVNVDQPLQFTVHASDPDDNDRITLSARGLPEYASFEPSTGSFEWIPRPNQVGEHTIIFIAQDTHGATAEDTVHITVNRSTNQPPVADAIVDQSIVQEGDTVILDGSNSRDPEGDHITYKWTQIIGPRVTINNSNQSIASFIAPDIPDDEERILLFELSVTDEYNGSDTATVEVRVVSDTTLQRIIANINAGEDPVTLLENNPNIGHLSPYPQFVIDNNAGYIYELDNWSFELTSADRNNLRSNGITYIYNGRNHIIRLTGQDTGGRIRAVNFIPQIQGQVDYTRPYRITIPVSDITRIATQIGLDLNTVNISIINLEPQEPIIITGFQEYYAVATSPDTVANPSQVGSYWQNYSSPDVSPTITPTANGINLSATLSAGQYAGIEITPIINTNTNIALQATPTASSEYSPVYSPAKVNDNCFDTDNNILENPANCEWTSSGERTPWIKLEWNIPRTIYKVVLYDRKNPLDHITDSQLEFSDGNTISVGELPNDGSPKAITFPAKTVTWILFRVLASGPESLNIGLNEFQAFEARDNTNFIANALTQLLSNVRGNTPFIIQLLDNAGQILSIPIISPNEGNWQGIIADLLDAVQKINPAFNLSSVTKLRIIIPADLIPPGESGNATLNIQGLFIETGTRLEYATDPDLNDEQKKFITDNITNAQYELISTPQTNYRILEVKKWDGILTPLGFNINGTTLSAFFIGKDIYVPHPSLLEQMTSNIPTLLATVKKRLEIILEHELDEASGIKDHNEVVLNEFAKYSINGLNFADIATILFKSFTGKIDKDFHERFLANLFTQGMGLFLTDGTYYKIIKEMLNPDANEQQIKSTYHSVISKFEGFVSTTISDKEFNYFAKALESKPNEFQNELGFTKLNTKQAFEKQQGTIPIDLNRFFIKNTSLSSAIKIDIEYLKRFIVFANMLPNGVKIQGLSEKDENDIVVAQLVAIIKQGLPEGKFTVSYNVRYENLTATNQSTTVYILTEETLNKIPETIRTSLKIVVPANLGYNRVTDADYEFYAAWEGLDKTRDEFIDLIYQIANELLTTMKIKEEEKDKILSKIKQKGIGFIPSWYDPIKYYKTIESQKSLLTAA